MLPIGGKRTCDRDDGGDHSRTLGRKDIRSHADQGGLMAMGQERNRFCGQFATVGVPSPDVRVSGGEREGGRWRGSRSRSRRDGWDCWELLGMQVLKQVRLLRVRQGRQDRV